ncbi:MAG: hypothetical protein ACI4RT_06195 [Candidatus Spyradenecus sp.]
MMGFLIGFHLGTQRRVQTGPLTKKQAVGALVIVLVVTSVFQGLLYWWPLWQMQQVRASERVEAELVAAEPLKEGVRLTLADPVSGTEQQCTWSAEQASERLQVLNGPERQVPCRRLADGTLEPMVFALAPWLLRVGLALFLTIFLGAFGGVSAEAFAWTRRHRLACACGLMSLPLVSALALSVMVDSASVVLLHLLLFPLPYAAVWRALGPERGEAAPEHSLLAWLRETRRVAWVVPVFGLAAVAAGVGCFIGDGVRLTQAGRSLRERERVELTPCGAWTTTSSRGRHGGGRTTTFHLLAAYTVGQRTYFAHWTTKEVFSLSAEATDRAHRNIRALRSGYKRSGSVAAGDPTDVLPCEAGPEEHPLRGQSPAVADYLLRLGGTLALLMGAGLLSAVCPLPGQARVYRYKQDNTLCLAAPQQAAGYLCVALPALLLVSCCHFVALWRVGLGIPVLQLLLLLPLPVGAGICAAIFRRKARKATTLHCRALGPGAWEVELLPHGRCLSKVEADGQALAIDRAGVGTWRFTVPPEARELLVLTGDKQVLVLRSE